MANPVLVECLNNVITKVAENVTTGFIKPLDRAGIDYSESYRMTGDEAPANNADFVPFPGILEISSSAPIDVYIIATSKLKDGLFKVRVDV